MEREIAKIPVPEITITNKTIEFGSNYTIKSGVDVNDGIISLKSITNDNGNNNNDLQVVLKYLSYQLEHIIYLQS